MVANRTVQLALGATLLVMVPAPSVGAPGGRPHGEISPAEVLQVIQTALREHGVANYDELRPENLRVQTTLGVAGEYAALQVVKIDYDSLRGETRFRLRASKGPRPLPFIVTTDGWRPLVRSLVARRDLRPGETPQPQDFAVELREISRCGELANLAPKELAGQQIRRPIRQGEVVRSEFLKPMTLARPGHPATLVMEGANLRIVTTVIPLQPGGKGQHIRIRGLSTGKVMTAEVVAPNLLRATLPYGANNGMRATPKWN